ncbi:MAG: N-acetylmuramoyl-L-alanine amidase [Chitinophagales bacterium]
MKNKLLLTSIVLLVCLMINSAFLNAPLYSIKTVVIDAGHGGKDTGCSGAHSREKDIALNIALKLGSYIEQNVPGVKVIYTRKTDVFIELHERAAIANHNQADLFISIHCNAAKNHPNVHGTETYIMGLDKSAENLDVSRRENSVILLENNYEHNYDGFDLNDYESNIIFSLYQNAFLNQSIDFASSIENEFKNQTKRYSRGVKQESFLVLYKTTMPSVLVEAGFLTNSAEETYLKSAEGQTYIASAIYRAFKAYKTKLEGVALPQASKIKRVEMGHTAMSNGDASTLIYKVQLYNAYQSLDLGNPDFERVGKIDIEENQRGIKQYVLATKFYDYDHALTALNDMKKAGFKHAQIVLYNNGKRIVN